ncbi:MAG: hypothetical protein HY868_18470 [Chloroflexi bacterium]|nr:hypothetical protein [Chloroflexota bacterium]
MIKTQLKRISMMFEQWLAPRPRTAAELQQFVARLFLCGALGYALFHGGFAWDQWNTPWRIPVLGNAVVGIINAVLIGALFRFELTTLRQHIERWRFVASANLLLWLFNFAWLLVLNVEWSFGTVLVIYYNIVNLSATLAVLDSLRRLARWVPETSQE